MKEQSVEDSRFQYLPELRDSTGRLLDTIRSRIELHQSTALADHVVRTGPGNFNEYAPLHEYFLLHLPPDQQNGARQFGELLSQLLLASTDHCRSPSLQEFAEGLVAEIRHIEGFCAVIAAYCGAETRRDESLLGHVEDTGALLGVLGDLLEQKLGKRRKPGVRSARECRPAVVDGAGAQS